LALIDRLAEEGISIAALEVCMHHPQGDPRGDPTLILDCACRKPKPGMLLSLIAGLGLAPEHSWMIGDSRGDLEAAEAAGLRAALIYSTKRCELCPLRAGPPGKPSLVAARFDEVAALILAARDQGLRV
jgi:D-glycero-D-manno-heptose 1,7-bisphosphate phosphatase